MASYYNKITGTLKGGELARSEDIHSIQSSIQEMIARVIVDHFGPAYILGHEENTLKLIPTPIHIDQNNLNTVADSEWISFYERYFRQTIKIEKSEIKSIHVQLSNGSDITVSVFAEIRDINFNLLQEANITLEPTGIDSYVDVYFEFGLQHLPIGHYYFVLRPVNVDKVDIYLNGDEDEYDTITADMFQIRYDAEGSYGGLLEASYNATDYANAILLDDAIINATDMVTLSDNIDLYFEQIYSEGNTYEITPGAAVILGQKTYPVDTHVTIDGPSSLGDRTDLVTLSADGKLNVIKGEVYNGEKIYPTSDAGLKIAYITTYRNSSDTWVCENCGYVNDGNLKSCCQCNTISKNIKIPLIEQADDTDTTRNRDILERIRRLEKKVKYDMDRNAPSRIKYICTLEPTIPLNKTRTLCQNPSCKKISEGKFNKCPICNSSNVKQENQDKEATYGMIASVDDNGDTVYIPDSGYNVEQYYWSIKEQSGIHEETKTDIIKGILTGYNLVKVFEQEGKFKANLTDPDTGNPLPNKEIEMTINGVTYKKTTDGLGNAYLDIKLNPGTYTITSKYGDAVVTNTVIVQEKASTETGTNVGTDTTMTIGTRVSTTSRWVKGDFIPNYIKTGDDSFYKDGVSVDVSEGTVTLQKTNYTDEYIKNKPLAEQKTFKQQTIKYTIRGNAQQGELTTEYAVLNLKIPNDCYIKSLTPYITKFQNIDRFGIILFRNDEVFDLTKTSRICYQKRFTDDPTFPNVFTSELYNLSDIPVSSNNTKTLSKPVTFNVDQEIPKGNYSLLVYGYLEKGKDEGSIIIEEYNTLSESETYGVSTKCLGTAQPTLLYLETNNISDRSWDLIIEKRPASYFDRGTLISQGIKTDRKIYSCSCSKNVQIPDGCSLKVYVSNNGGKTWVDASNGAVTFSGTGNTFKWRLILTGNGSNTPVLKYDPAKRYAILFNVGTANTYIEYEDYGRCFETRLLDGNYLTGFLLGDSNIASQKRFSEWEFARLWMSNMGSNTTIDICTSYEDSTYLTVDSQNKAYWPKDLFFSTIIASAIENDFSTMSVDYDNYDDSVEADEHNYKFDLDETHQFNYNSGVVICTGTTDDGLGNINRDNINMEEFVYLNHDDLLTYNYDGTRTSTKTSNYTTAMYRPDESLMETDSFKFYSPQIDNFGDELFEDNAIIVGKSFPDGLNIDDSYTDLIIDIIPKLKVLDDNEKYRRAVNQNGDIIIPAGTLEVVVSLNVNGAIENDDATYGKAYPIYQDLINEKHNDVSLGVDFQNDIYAYGEVRSIGIRFNKNALRHTQTTSGEANGTVYETFNGLRCYKSSTKQEDNSFLICDEIGIGNMRLSGYNIRPVIPYGYKNFTWRNNTPDQKSSIYTIWRVNGQVGGYGIPWEGKDYYLTGWLPIGTDARPTLDTDGNFKFINGYLVGQPANKISNITDSGNDGVTYYRTVGTHFYDINIEDSQLQVVDFEKIQKDGSIGTVFELAQGETGNLFKIKVNTPITPYNFFRVSYSLPTINDEDDLSGSFGKGEIFIDLYNTDNIDDGSLPIESFALPAWGRVQSQSNVDDKICNALFKKRTNEVNTIKWVVIRRENPLKTPIQQLEPITLLINDIVMYTTSKWPMLGSKLLMRVYPNSFDDLERSKIRKYGVVYTLK